MIVHPWRALPAKRTGATEDRKPPNPPDIQMRFVSRSVSSRRESRSAARAASTRWSASQSACCASDRKPLLRVLAPPPWLRARHFGRGCGLPALRRDGLIIVGGTSLRGGRSQDLRHNVNYLRPSRLSFSLYDKISWCAAFHCLFPTPLIFYHHEETPPSRPPPSPSFSRVAARFPKAPTAST